MAGTPVDESKARASGRGNWVDHKALFSNPEIDAIAIATPVATHHDLALRAPLVSEHTPQHLAQLANVGAQRQVVGRAGACHQHRPS